MHSRSDARWSIVAAVLLAIVVAVGCSDDGSPATAKPVVWHAVASDDDAGAFYGVWSASPNDVWIVGGEASKAVVRHFDGSTWSRRDPPLQQKLRWVHGDGAGSVIVVGDGGSAALWKNGAWAAIPTGHDQAVLWGAWLAADGQAWAVGGVEGAANAGDTSDTLLLLHHDPTTHDVHPWKLVPLPNRAGWPKSAESRLFKIWRDTPSGQFFAVGGGSLAMRTDSAGAWQAGVADPSGASLFTVHGRSANDVWAIGGLFGALIVHFDGSAWHEVEAPSDAPLLVQGIAVQPDGVVDIAGAAGFTARRSTKGVWTSSVIETTANLHGIRHDGTRTWAVGGDIQVDKADHHGMIFCDDARVPAI